MGVCPSRIMPKRTSPKSFSPDFLSDNSPINHDITFKFLEDDPGEVSAHKTILGMGSKVFLNMFFKHGTTDKSVREIVMKNTNRAAFKIMIEGIYNSKSMEENLRGKSLHEMFAVLHLVTQYEISDLVLAVKACLSSFPITEVDSVLDIASDAVKYLDTFEEEAQNVLLRCAKFLNEDVKSFRKFVSKNSDRFDIVERLIILMDEMKPPVCRNCLNNPCLHGVHVKQKQFREGLKVAQNPGAGSMWRARNFRGEIKKVVKDTTDVQLYAAGNFDVSENRNMNSKFVFRCK